MRTDTILLVLILSVSAQKGFTPDYFIKKHNLKIPVITKEMLDISKHTHKSDSWFYYYLDSDNRVDSVYRFLNIEGFSSNKSRRKYIYRNDSVFIHTIGVSDKSHDTTNNNFKVFTDNYCTQYTHNLAGKPYKNYYKQTAWGKVAMDKWQYPGEKKPHGRDFKFIEHEDYIESIEIDNGKVDSTDRRFYYFTPFDSLISMYIVKYGKKPAIATLRYFNKTNKLKFKYTFDFYEKDGIAEGILYKIYTKTNKPDIEYLFSIKDRKAPKKDYELSNYTKYTYDKRDRKKTMITRVVPDPEYHKNNSKVEK